MFNIIVETQDNTTLEQGNGRIKFLCYNFGVSLGTSSRPKTSAARAVVIVRGLVQGVSYRWYTQRRAEDLGLTGFVRNANDGSVHATIEGDRAAIQELLDWMGTGPAAAVVESVQTEWHTPSGEFIRFEVRS
ncbi:MAG: acylphosphatase [Anaerolineae bacterium]|nr:acylphosphatase [Anaerolineae bacterium]